MRVAAERELVPSISMVPCVCRGLKKTPHTARAINNSVFDKLPDGEEWKLSARYLYPLVAASLNEIVGAKKVNPKKVNPKKVNPESQSSQRFLQSHNFTQRGSSRRV